MDSLFNNKILQSTLWICGILAGFFLPFISGASTFVCWWSAVIWIVIAFPDFIAKHVNHSKVNNFRLVLLSTFLLYMAFPYLTFFAWFAFVPFFFLMKRIKTTGRLFWYSLLCSTFSMAMGYNYLVFTMDSFGGIGAFWGFIGLLAFSVMFNFKMVVFFISVYWVEKRVKFPKIILYPVAWIVIEYVFPEMLPYYLGGMLYNQRILIQFADIFGVNGLSVPVMMVNVGIFHIIEYLVSYIKPKSGDENKDSEITKKSFPFVTTSLAAAVLIFLTIYGTVRINQIEEQIEQSEPVTVGMVQTCAGKRSFSERRNEADNLENLVELSKDAYYELDGDMDLLIWPESSINFNYFGYNYPSPRTMDLGGHYYLNEYNMLSYNFLRPEPSETIVKILHNLAKTPESDEVNETDYDEVFSLSYLGTQYDYHIKNLDTTIIASTNRFTSEPNIYYNTIVGIGPDDRPVGFYDKMFMVWFGEYQPWPRVTDFLRKYFEELQHSTSNFIPAMAVRTIPLGEEHILAPVICYESIIPYHVRKFVEQGADILVETTNLVWFSDPGARGEDTCTRQHTALALFRCVENRVPLAKATNTGISTFIDATGKISDRKTPINEVSFLTGEIRPLKDYATFYTRNGDILPLIMIFIFGIILLSTVIIASRRYKKQEKDIRAKEEKSRKKQSKKSNR